MAYSPIFNTKEDEDADKKESPKGFEKFLKKTRKGVPKTEDKKENKEKKDEDDDLSEEEEAAPKETKKK